MSDGSWLTYAPRPHDVPSLQYQAEMGFPERLAQTSLGEAQALPEWAAAEQWWHTLDHHLRLPRGLLCWGEGLPVLMVMARRLMCWRHLPVPRGVRLAPVAYTEATDLHQAARREEARAAGTLLVGGVGTVEYSLDKELEVLVGLARQRQRAGGLTLWHLDPVGTWLPRWATRPWP